MENLVIIIGAMKCGTSSLYRYVAQHPEICSCRMKEPEFFSQNQDHGAEVRRYEDLWDFNPRAHSWCIEASTGYTKFPREQGVPKRMAEYSLDPRFIYIVRDPVERIESDFNYLRQHPHLSAGSSPLGEEYLNRSRYFLQLDQFLQYYPDRERYLTLEFKKLATDPASVAKKVFQFLDLPPFEIESPEAHNETETVSIMEQLFRRRGFYKLRHLVPASLRSSVREALLTLSWTARRELSADEKKKIRTGLQDDMCRFESVFGFDVEKWEFECG